MLRKTYKIPVFFHNFRGFDGHIIARAMGEFKNQKLSVIGQGMEKYLTLSFGYHLQFKDSYMFLSASLQQLGKNLLSGGREKFAHLKKEFPGLPDDKLDLLLRKGVYPYEYMNSWDRFKEQQLPPRDKFFSKLVNAGISEEYQHAQRVWTDFDCRTMQDYHDLYLKSRN